MSDANKVYDREKWSYGLPAKAQAQKERLSQENSETYSFSLPKSLAAKMNRAAAENRVSRSKVIQAALEDFFNNYGI